MLQPVTPFGELSRRSGESVARGKSPNCRVRQPTPAGGRIASGRGDTLRRLADGVPSARPSLFHFPMDLTNPRGKPKNVPLQSNIV